MGNSVSRNQFVNDLNKQHGTIDLNHMSEELKTALSKAGIDDAKMQEIAGPDGQIKGKAEYKNLFSMVDQFDPKGSPKSFTKYEDPKATSPVLTKSGQLYETLKSEVDKNRAEARYAQPGVKKAAVQARSTVDSNALSVPEKERKAAVNLGVKGKNQFDFEEGGTACFKAAKFQCEEYNKAHFGKAAPKLNDDPNQAIQVAYAEDKNGKLAVDQTQAKVGRDYIDLALEKGYPANVGVSYKDNNYNNDKMTDHFVTIYSRGYDDKGRLYYDYKDPGNGGRDGRFYVDKDSGKFFKERTKTNPQYVGEADYEMTQVRTYTDLK